LWAGISRPGNCFFDMVEEFGVDGHHVFVVAMDGAVFDHPNFAVAFDDLCLNFADLSFIRSRQSFLP